VRSLMYNRNEKIVLMKGVVMATRIIINDKEMTNPYVKGLLIFGAINIAALVTAIVIFVLLPIIGVAVTLTVSFILIFIAATLVSMATLALVAVITSWIFGAAEFRIEKSYRKK